MKKKIIIISLIIIIITLIGIMVIRHSKYSKRSDVKIPILLYHNFVTVVPESDPDNFNYINTPQSFEENVNL